jgi:hypothetical protein
MKSKADKAVAKAVGAVKSEQGGTGSGNSAKYTGEKCAKTSGHGSGQGSKGVKGKYTPGGGK